MSKTFSKIIINFYFLTDYYHLQLNIRRQNSYVYIFGKLTPGNHYFVMDEFNDKIYPNITEVDPKYHEVREVSTTNLTQVLAFITSLPHL